MEHFITCKLCGGSSGTMKHIGENVYAHVNQADCRRQRAKDMGKRQSAPTLLASRPGLILPR